MATATASTVSSAAMATLAAHGRQLDLGVPAAATTTPTATVYPAAHQMAEFCIVVGISIVAAAVAAAAATAATAATAAATLTSVIAVAVDETITVTTQELVLRKGWGRRGGAAAKRRFCRTERHQSEPFPPQLCCSLQGLPRHRLGALHPSEPLSETPRFLTHGRAIIIVASAAILAHLPGQAATIATARQPLPHAAAKARGAGAQHQHHSDLQH